MPANKNFFDPASLEGDEEEAAAPPAAPVANFENVDFFATVPQAAAEQEPLSLALEDPTAPLTLATEDAGLVQNDLSTQFTDPDLATPAPAAEATSLVQETAEAVHELVQAEPEIFSPEQVGGINTAHNEMAKALFPLVLCDYKFDVLAEEILKILMKSVDAHVGSILELDHRSEEFFFRAACGGEPDKVKNFRIPCNKGIVGHVAESRQYLLVNELEDSSLQLKSISLAVGFEAKSCLAVPIIVANQFYGVLEVFNKIGINYFDNNDAKTLEEGVKWAAKVLEVRFFVAEMLRQKEHTTQKVA